MQRRDAKRQELFLRQLKQMDLDDPQIRMAATEHVRWTTITRSAVVPVAVPFVGDVGGDVSGMTSPLLLSPFAVAVSCGNVH